MIRYQWQLDSVISAAPGIPFPTEWSSQTPGNLGSSSNYPTQVTDAFAARRLDATVKAGLAGRSVNEIED